MTAPIYMDAQITPNRSLSDRGMKVVLGIVIAFNALVALFLLAVQSARTSTGRCVAAS